MSAATSTRNSRPGPSVMMSPEVVVVIGAERIVPIVASIPASTHTSVDMRLTLMAARRAASGFAAAARTAIPYFVRLRKSASAMVSSGTTTRMSTCSPRTMTPPIVHVLLMGVGNDR